MKKGSIAMGVLPMYNDIELTVEPHYDDDTQYVARLPNGDPQISYVPEELLDLIPWMAARRLLAAGYDVDRLLVVHLVGSDREMMRRPLGVACATPIPDDDHPVEEAACIVYPRRRKVPKHG